MDNTRTGSPLMGVPLLIVTGWSTVVPMPTGTPPIIRACDQPGHKQVTCMFCQVSYCSVCDGHSC
ncbi:hypothetical protein GCM10023088_62760 [Actinomadura verrucosospora]